MTATTNAPECPALIEPEIAGTFLESWLQERRVDVEGLLLRHKALLFRGFRHHKGLESVSDSLFERRLRYSYRSTPRRSEGEDIYTATEYPKQRSIPQHCENAYQRQWPLRLLFHCVEPAASGGCTPLADMVHVTASIDAEIKAEFERRHVRYVRNYRPGMDLPWQEVFGTSEPEEVNAYCAAHDIQCEWLGKVLRTSQVCQAMATHPVTGERLWFNQAHLFHVSSLDEAMRDLLLGAYGELGLPRHATFGDGQPIPPALLDNVRQAHSAHLVRFDWQQDDILLVDNMRVSHGRDPFEGNRKVLVCMAEPYAPESGDVG